MSKIKIVTNNYIGGGYTFIMETGVHSDVHVFDFKSMYPCVITTANICYTTAITKEYAEEHNIPYLTIPSDYHITDGRFYEEKYFRIDKRGIIPERMDELIKLRDIKKYEKFKYKESNPDLYKKLKSEEQALKILSNSGYGYFGFKNSRFYNPYVANAITQFSRFLTKQCIKKAEECGYKVIQGDTDSIFIVNVENKITIKELEYEFYKLFDEISEKYNIKSKKFEQKNPLTGEKETKNHFIILEHEKTFKRLVNIKKKNYATLMVELDEDGNEVGEPEIYITGLECKKKDTNLLAKEWQYKLLVDVYLLNKITIQEYIEELYKLKEKFINNEIDSKYLIMQKGLNKHPDSYGQPVIDSKTGKPKIKKDGTIQMSPIPAHVVLAKKMIEEGKDVNVGDMIQYIVKKAKPKIEAISIEEFEKNKKFDKSYYWERTINPILKVLFVIDRKIVYDNVSLWFIKKGKNDIKKLNTIEKKFNRE